MNEFTHFFQWQVEKPGLFSPFHFISLLIIIVSTILVSKIFKNCSYLTYKKIIIFSWLFLVILEIIKQLVKSFYYGPPSYWEYSFYNLPFHLCSTIYYIAPILLFMNKDKHPKIYNALIGFMGIFVLMAGSIVILYNDIVMSEMLFTNIQSMAHHGVQVILGVFIVVWNKKQYNFKTFLSSLIVLAIFTIIALLINIIIAPFGGIDMFYVNPYEITVLPIGSYIQENFGFIPYFIVYLIVIILGGFITYSIEILSIHKFNFKKIFMK